jgi:hypothetical protein
VKIGLKFYALMSLAILGVGLVITGCKSAPQLPKDQALSLIQAYYDAQPPAGFDITVDNNGMIQGATAKYWQRTTIYPNKYWADFKLTDQGKKVVKLSSGGDTIQWRPSSPTDSSFTVVVTTVQANHRKARDLKDIQDVGSKVKTVVFTEAVDLTGLPDTLTNIAHNPGNQLSTSRTAQFDLDNGAWKVKSVE